MTDLRCMTYTSRGTSEILVAGLQDVMFTIDVDKGRITKEVGRSERQPYRANVHGPLTGADRDGEPVHSHEA